MKIADADILFIPDHGGTAASHWQGRWAARLSTGRIAAPDNWPNLDGPGWADHLHREILMATRPVVLVAHGLGVIATATAATRLADTKVRGAFLVAPPDLETEHPRVADIAGFTPVPRDPLPFPSLTIASTNDPACAIEQAAEYAIAWGSEFHVAGEAGHFDLESGHGPWPEGLLMFTRLMQRLKA